MQFSNKIIEQYFNSIYTDILKNQYPTNLSTLDVIIIAEKEILLLTPDFVSQMDYLVALNNHIKKNKFTSIVKKETNRWSKNYWLNIKEWKEQYISNKTYPKILINPSINKEIFIKYLYNNLTEAKLIQNEFISFKEHFIHSYSLFNKLVWLGKENELFNLIYWLIEYQIISGEYLEIIMTHFTHHKKGDFIDKNKIAANKGKKSVKNLRTQTIADKIKIKFLPKS
jgi:hypothetical protein